MMSNKIKELYTDAIWSLNEANLNMRYCIEALVEELGDRVDLEHLPLVYVTNGGEIHTTYADSVFSKDDPDMVEFGGKKYQVGIVWFDEDGNKNEANEYLCDLSANELYGIMDKLHMQLVNKMDQA